MFGVGSTNLARADKLYRSCKSIHPMNFTTRLDLSSSYSPRLRTRLIRRIGPGAADVQRRLTASQTGQVSPPPKAPTASRRIQACRPHPPPPCLPQVLESRHLIFTFPRQSSTSIESTSPVLLTQAPRIAARRLKFRTRGLHPAATPLRCVDHSPHS